jgi:hypothetical protein
MVFRKFHDNHPVPYDNAKTKRIDKEATYKQASQKISCKILAFWTRAGAISFLAYLNYFQK